MTEEANYIILNRGELEMLQIRLGKLCSFYEETHRLFDQFLIDAAPHVQHYLKKFPQFAHIFTRTFSHWSLWDKGWKSALEYYGYNEDTTADLNARIHYRKFFDTATYMRNVYEWRDAWFIARDQLTHIVQALGTESGTLNATTSWYARVNATFDYYENIVNKVADADQHNELILATLAVAQVKNEHLEKIHTAGIEFETAMNKLVEKQAVKKAVEIVNASRKWWQFWK